MQPGVCRAGLPNTVKDERLSLRLKSLGLVRNFGTVIVKVGNEVVVGIYVSPLTTCPDGISLVGGVDGG